jgi:hypothetical protein
MAEGAPVTFWPIWYLPAPIPHHARFVEHVCRSATLFIFNYSAPL